MRTVQEVASESTCMKRKVVCELLDATGARIEIESNRCSRLGGACVRLGVVSEREGYPLHSECNWTHAEIMALNAMTAKPDRAVIYGHNFPCPACEAGLRQAGVTEIEMREL